ncbi:MAG TPA: diaminopimelate epimerase [bacterium]|nr:diaminopimelate epimerase [bacterium]
MEFIPFSKYHGLGNDYLFLDAVLNPELEKLNLRDLAVTMSHRRTGPGADGIVLVASSSRADVRMRIFNLDGSEAENCGNALRCVARLCHEKHHIQKQSFLVEIADRTVSVSLDPRDTGYRKITVDIGRPVWTAHAVPVAISGDTLHVSIPVADQVFDASILSVGNPHCVIFLDSFSEDDVRRFGPLVEQLDLFPNRVNVGFCTPIHRNHIRLTVWERGAGLTGACGTGATAAFAAALRRGLVESPCRVEMPGGNLEFAMDDRSHILMTGPAEHVYDGRFYLRKP